MIPLFRLAHYSGSSAALSGMLTRPGKIAKPPLWILFIEGSTDGLF
jgi:hypothetical protein